MSVPLSTSLRLGSHYQPQCGKNVSNMGFQAGRAGVTTKIAYASKLRPSLV
jgi:hypothetical protein